MNRCAAGHTITAAFAFCECNKVRHFLWGHTCPDDGRYWGFCPVREVVASGTDWQEAATALRGTWA